MCKYMNIQPYGTDAYLRYSLRTKLSWYTLLDFKPLSRNGLWTFALFVVLEAPSWSVVQPTGFGTGVGQCTSCGWPCNLHGIYVCRMWKISIENQMFGYIKPRVLSNFSPKNMLNVHDLDLISKQMTHEFEFFCFRKSVTDCWFCQFQLDST
jgi:hypothetical protein